MLNKEPREDHNMISMQNTMCILLKVVASLPIHRRIGGVARPFGVQIFWMPCLCLPRFAHVPANSDT